MKTLLVALGVTALVGCSGFKPVGPLAKQAPITQQGQPLPDAPAESSAARPPAVRPTPPSMLVTPGEVTPDNARDIASKLTTEITTDINATPAPPVTVEVSHIKGGVKQK